MGTPDAYSVLTVIRELREAGMTMVVVSHEIAFAREAANRVVFLNEGRVIEEGSPQQVLGSPRHERTREFLSRFLS